ncbi:MAG: hypothetical protein ACTSVU_07280 [Promethearchaeota archaeon]
MSGFSTQNCEVFRVMDDFGGKKMKRNLNKMFRKRSRNHRASQGMTAAIILIAFIITAAGIAFVILTMGSEMQLELGNVGEEGRDSASSALQVEGGVVTGYSNASSNNISAYAFNLKLVLQTGQVDLSDGHITLWIKVGSSLEVALTKEATMDSLVKGALSANSGKYNIVYYDEVSGGSSNVLTHNEMARFYIGMSGTAAVESTEVVIILNSEVATLKITKTIPVGITDGVNVL